MSEKCPQLCERSFRGVGELSDVEMWGARLVGGVAAGGTGGGPGVRLRAWATERAGRVATRRVCLPEAGVPCS